MKHQGDGILHTTEWCGIEPALVGDTANPMQGEISPACTDVLFLDEFPKFARKALEVMRRPTEDRVITVSQLRQLLFSHKCQHNETSSAARSSGRCTLPSALTLWLLH